MKGILVICLAILAIGCDCIKGEKVKSVETTGNREIVVEFLFEVDGVRIYRFQDCGYARYFSTVGMLQSLSRHQNGKTTVMVDHAVIQGQDSSYK